MAVQTPRLLKKTEEAILSFLEDDIETTLPLIERLEEISYQLWKENNLKFLFGDDLGLDEEEEEWFWDEEVFFDHSSRVVPPTPYTPYQEKVTYISDVDSNYSSYGESSIQSTSCSAPSSKGYRGSCESVLSTSTLHNNIKSNADDWIIISSELSCTEAHDWLLVSQGTREEERSFWSEFHSNSCNETCDWTILSVRVNSSTWIDDISLLKTNKSSNSSIRRQLFQSTSSDISCYDSGGNIDNDSVSPFVKQYSIDKRKEIIPGGHFAFRVEDSKEEWIIVSYKVEPPEKPCSGRQQQTGQISPQNEPRLATVT